MKNIRISGRSFVKPSFIEGVSRILDLGVTLRGYNSIEAENKADIEAIKGDWQTVGNDFRISVKNYERSLAKAT